MKKLLFVIPHLGGGGTGKLAVLLSNELTKRGYRVYIVLFENRVDYETVSEVLNLEVPGSTDPIRKLRNFFLRRARLRRAIRQIRPDSVLSFLEGPNLLSLLATSEPILSLHESCTKTEDQGKYKILNDFVVRNLYQRAAKIVAVSEGIKNELTNIYKLDPGKVRVIYNPVDIKSIGIASEEELEEGHRNIFLYPTIISVGRMTRAKGQWHLIRVFNKLRTVFDDLQLVILGGEGELEAHLFELKKTSKYSGNIHLLGFQRNPYKFISRSKLFVFPSLWEGFGMSIIEALACGTPVISSDCRYGPREILAPDTNIYFETRVAEKGKYGVLVPVCDGQFRISEPLSREEEVLAEAVIDLLKHTNALQYYSKKGVERATDFEITKITQEYESVFNS